MLLARTSRHPRAVPQVRHLALLAGALLLLFLGVPAGRAQPAGRELDFFSVIAIPVDASAETASAAKGPALAEGQRKALRILLQRMTLRADQDKLPRVDENMLNGLVRGIELADERTSATRYLARLTVRFNADGVRRLLRSARIPFTESLSRPVVVVPVFEQDDGSRVLWEADSNPWRQAWADREIGDALVPILLPRSDVIDAGAVDARTAIAGDEARLAKFAQRYGTTDSLVALAALQGDSDRPTAIQVTVQRHGGGAIYLAETFSVAASATATGATLMAQAVKEVAARLDDGWKQNTVIRFDAENSLSATVRFASLGDWIALRDRVGQVAGMQRVDVATMTNHDAQVVLHYFGNPQQLATVLAQRDLQLAEVGGFWTLNLASARPQ